MDHKSLKEMEKALAENKTLETLKLADGDDDADYLPEDFCRHVLICIRRNTSLSEVYLTFFPDYWDCPVDIGWCMSVACCVTQLDVVYSV